ncbi:Positive regulator of purine utilization [Leucoagaricus sp. SymC.cos]|nr:Positive regulator of purine utilization [Leucoagaricus sp. SymC.cos]
MLPSTLGGQNGAAQPSSLQSALQIPDQHLLQQQQAAAGGMSPGGSAPKRRRKPEDDGGGGAEPRRLRRSHEACARCRSKKIKASPCDSKHPRCTACATAGTVCNQEDRHRQRLTPRGLTMRMEQMLAQCEALLKIHIQDFDINRLDEFLARAGLDPNSITAANLTADFQIQDAASPRPFQIDPAAPPPVQQGSPKAYPVYPGPPIIHPYPPPHMMHYPGPYPPLPPHMQGPPGMYPPFHPPPPAPQVPRPVPVKGTDPNGNDMSDAETLAKNFGVSPGIVGDLKLSIAGDREDLAVGYNGLTSGRDRPFHESIKPRNPSYWIPLTIPRNGSVPSTLALPSSPQPAGSNVTVTVWLPKDRNMFKEIADVYFTHLNIHRPVYSRKEFDKIVNDMYDQSTSGHDPGHICGVYLVLALGTLSELNNRAVKANIDNKDSTKTISSIARDLMPLDWPDHDEFFERALAVKPDLRVSLSSLQALILLHWYLYTERQGRTLWRLVGSLVRLSIELGLHHDPSTQFVPSPQGPHLPMLPLFTDEEIQLRIRLWGIVLMHDRGTSILLGRPLAIAPSDTNTPRPSRHKGIRNEDFSEHFELSGPVAEIQADIINSLYTPKKQSGDTVMRNATRIIKSMIEFRRCLPERYKYYFSGTKDWPLEKKSKLVHEITEDEGLTLLKLGIARILLLRALFSSKELSYPSRHQALVDAIITSHNIIVIHNQLIRFPDIAFFTSPIPLHIAAMVILFGHMSRCEVLPLKTALEDLWMALDMIPRFRWRWERKDAAGGHPLIARLVERVMNVDLHTIGPSSHPVMICEPEWDEEGLNSPRAKASQTTPPITSTTFQAGPAGYGGVVRPGMNGAPGASGPGALNNVGAPGPASGGASSTGGGTNTPPHKRLVDMPPNLFYPFYPEAPLGQDGPNSGGHEDYRTLLAAAAAAQDSSFQPAQNNFMSEERTPDPPPSHHQSPSQQHQPQTPQIPPAQPTTGPSVWIPHVSWRSR